jgi:hypothetical protein
MNIYFGISMHWLFPSWDLWVSNICHMLRESACCICHFWFQAHPEFSSDFQNHYPTANCTSPSGYHRLILPSISTSAVKLILPSFKPSLLNCPLCWWMVPLWQASPNPGAHPRNLPFSFHIISPTKSRVSTISIRKFLALNWNYSNSLLTGPLISLQQLEVSPDDK